MSMTRRGLLAGLFAVLGAPLAVEVQQALKTPRVGYLAAASMTSTVPIVFVTAGDPVSSGLVASLVSCL